LLLLAEAIRIHAYTKTQHVEQNETIISREPWRTTRGKNIHLTNLSRHNTLKRKRKASAAGTWTRAGIDVTTFQPRQNLAGATTLTA